MRQPIKKLVIDKYPELTQDSIPLHTLIIDANNLLNISMVDTKRNSSGLHVGGIFQFLLQIKMMLKKGNSGWDFVYCMWDGPDSGILRYELYPLYKANRDKNYTTSEYEKQLNDFVRRTIAYSKQKQGKTEQQINNEKEDFDRERFSIMKYLEELYIRQVMVDKVEGDDLIAYYVKNKKPNEKIVIMSSDRDYLQLVKEDVILYVPTTLKTFVTTKNHKELIGYPQENALLRKILLGDTSDNIKGVKGLGEKTLEKYFPDIKNKAITLEEIKEKAKLINEERVINKQKPLEVCNNIINGISDGHENGKVYEINNKIINLFNPIMTDEAIDVMNDIMYAPISPEGRSFQNLYKMIIEDDIIDLKDDNKFTTFFGDFKRLTNKEEEYYKKTLL